MDIVPLFIAQSVTLEVLWFSEVLSSNRYGTRALQQERKLRPLSIYFDEPLMIHYHDFG